jgi:hypothetical protein
MSGTAVAGCGVCTPNVRFDEALAGCFEKAFDTELSRLKGGQKIVMVNLSACAEQAGTRGDTLPGPASQTLDFALVADETGLLCLKAKLAAAARPLNPSAVFEIDSACQ